MISFITRCLCKEGFFYSNGQCLSSEQCGCPTDIDSEPRRYDVRTKSI